ncbi:MAG TPA: carboxypeptidase-like regulatory domain-containing protein, partial [Bacteroidia bacterium]|nr:carboxypeptidase-like regulatory domain-containing protein [Bacteroidia bacterium]
MYKRILGTLLFFSGISFSISAQNKYTISGYIKDIKTGEQLIGASIIIKDMPATGVNTNSYGFYSITIPEGRHILMAQFTGYQTKIDTIVLDKNTKLDFAITDAAAELTEVVVTDEKKDQNVTATQMGVDKLDIKQIQTIPVFFGEKDVLKTLQLLPGVKSVGDGSSGFYVRGGNSSQNLILLDEATVYNASHLLGFFSVFN